MNKLLAIIPAILALSTATARAAGTADVPGPNQKTPERRLSPVSLGMRVGLSLPAGRIDSGTNAAQVFGLSMMNDLFLDVRLGDRLVLAPYAGYLQGTGGSATPSCSSSAKNCGLSGVQAGAMLRGTFARTSAVDVWVGYAFSRQWLAFSNSEAGVTARFAGNDHHAAVGADFFLNERNDTRLGAYLDVGFGKYDHASVTNYGGTFESTTHEVHQWTTFGMQAVF